LGDEDLEEAVKFEAKKYIPNSLDEVAIDWEVVGEKENSEKQNEILQRQHHILTKLELISSKKPLN